MSQSGILKLPDSILPPDVPTLFDCNVGSAVPASNVLNIFAEYVLASGVPAQTFGTGNTVQTEIQLSSASGISSALNAGLCSFNSSEFTVDANGYVTLSGSGSAIVFDADSGSATPSLNIINFKGNTTQGISSSASGNTVTYTIADATATQKGVASFNLTEFSVTSGNVTSNNFSVIAGTGLSGGGSLTLGGSVTLSINGAVVGETITGDSGGALSPTAGNWNIIGGTVVAGTSPVKTSGSVSTLTVNVQRSQAIASTDATKIGLSNYSSAQFAVDANGFVTLAGGSTAPVLGIVPDAHTAPGTTPVIPNGSGNITFTGSSTAAGTTPVQTNSLAANTVAVQVQKSQAIASTDATKVGLASFDSARFSVDANGFVSINGAGVGETITGDSGGALSPTSGNWNIIGGTVAAGISPVKTSGSVSTLTVNVQKTQAIASTDATKIGLASFDSAAFDVDANGFVQLNGGGIAATSFTVDANTAPGTNPVVPTAAGSVTIEAAAVAAHSVPIETRSRAANTFKVEVQEAAANATTDATKSGIAHFDSARFTVDANGFVSANGSGLGETITGQSGGALSPSSGNWNINGATVAAGTSPLVTAGSGSTLTINAQRSQAIASADATKVGLSNFNSAQFSVDANGFVSATGTVAITTTENSGTATPSSGNLSLLGTNSALTGYSPWTTGSGSTATFNMPGTVKWVVNATANLGTHTTIQAAINAASSGDNVFITPGTYTENLTLKIGVNLTAYGSDAITGQVIINGKATFTGAGNVSIYGIELQTNSDYFLSVTGSSASVVVLTNCNFNCLNNTGIQYTSSSGSSGIYILKCRGNLGTTGIAWYTSSGAGFIDFEYFQGANSGGSTTASAHSAGSIFHKFCQFASPFSCSSTGVFSCFYTDYITNAINTTAITTAGSGNSNFQFCYFLTGTASSLSIGTGTIVTCSTCNMNSSNTNNVTGAGTFQNFVNSLTTSTQSNVTTQNGGAATGVTQGTAPSAGYIGEQITSAVTNVSMSTTVAKTLTSINITAGIWDISIVGDTNSSNGTGTLMQLGISLTNNTFEGNLGDQKVQLSTSSGTWANLSGAIPAFRATLASTTTYYLVARMDGGGTITGNGRITATRVG